MTMVCSLVKDVDGMSGVTNSQQVLLIAPHSGEAACLWSERYV